MGWCGVGILVPSGGKRVGSVGVVEGGGWWRQCEEEGPEEEVQALECSEPGQALESPASGQDLESSA